MIVQDTEIFIAWVGGAAINADGSPRCYGPKNKGLDYTANGGKPGNWWGVVVDTQGNPIIQGPDDPFPGLYISTTSLVDKGYEIVDTRRYIDSETVPFIAIPRDGVKQRGVKLGDVCIVYNKNKDLHCYGVVADIGPAKKWNGELSIEMGRRLGIKNLSPRNGGLSKGFTYLVFKKSTKGWPRSQAEVRDQAEALLAAFGGLEKVKALK